MGCLAEKGQGLLKFRAVRKATDPQEAQRLIADALPSVVASVLQPAELEAMHQRLKQLPEPPERAPLAQGRLAGCPGRFSLVFLSTFPVVIPFIFMHNAGLALRVSNGIAIVMLFLTGYAFGRWRASAVADGHFDGGSRVDSRRPDHGPGRMTPLRSLVCMAIGVLFASDRALAGAANTMAAPAEEAHEKA